jgi:hypothetical protein
MMSDDRAESLAAVARQAERHADEVDDAPSYRRRHPPRDPAQVYSLRIPVAQLEELRQLAADQGVTPSALMREWVLERIAAEKAGMSGAQSIWDRLRQLLAGLEDIQRRLNLSAQAESTEAWAGLDPQGDEHREIRALITDQVVQRMETEIAEWKQQRASAADSVRRS